MIVLSGAELVLPDRIVSNGTLTIDAGRIVGLQVAPAVPSGSAFALRGHYILPGFIDVHVHGAAGVDSLDGGDAIARLAAALPQYGVSAFCPTMVACDPASLADALGQVKRARETPAPRSARVLPAHLESNFLNAEFAGAQPVACFRQPRAALARVPEGGEFSGSDVLTAIERASPDVGIVTLAPELEGGLDLIAWLVDRGHRVSLGHSGASYEQAMSAIAAGARQATHLFNRMPPLHHRRPGLAGAVLQSDDVVAELVCDGVHVHPALVRAALAAKQPSRIMAITDGTALSGMPVGASHRLGSQTIVSDGNVARLGDGTLAGSLLTMDRAFRTLVSGMGVSLVDAAVMCATTAARQLGLVGHGVLTEGAVADLVVLDPQFEVIQTYIGGQLVYARSA